MRIANIYRDEADRCDEAHAYLAGSVMIGAALEAALLAFAHCYWHETIRSHAKPLHNDSPKPLLDWTLFELLRVAKDLDWLPSALKLNEEFDDAVAQIGDYAEVVRYIRNLVHPARYLEEMPGEVISDQHLEFSYKVLEIATDYLMNKIGTDLRPALGEEEHQ